MDQALQLADRRDREQSDRFRRRLICFGASCAVVLIGIGLARAQNAGDTVIVAPIEVKGTSDAKGKSDAKQAPRTAGAKRSVQEPAFVTTIDVERSRGETTTVPEVLAKSVGVSVRSLGGLGGFSSISIRGAASGHTAVLIDGVPLSRLASVTADLSRFELRSFSEIELYRGGVPPELGGAGLGGAVNLITGIGRSKNGDRINASMGAGSFGARHLRLRGQENVGRGAFVVSLGYAGVDGDFRFFSDNGTNLNPDDDGFVDRTNNAFERFDLVARYGLKQADLSVEAGVRGAFKTQGVPGSQSVQTRATRLTTLSNLVDIKLVHGKPFGRSDALGAINGYVLVESQHFEDPDGEVGLAMQDRRLLTLSGGLNARLSAALGKSHVLSAGVEASFDVFDQRDALTDAHSDGGRLRFAVTASDDVFLLGDRWLVQPAVRLDVMTTRAPSELDGPMLESPSPRSDLYPSPRLSTRVKLTANASLKANAGWYFRAPTAMELFGDRGFIVGNPELRAETGISGDFGFAFAAARRHGGFDRLFAEAAVFASRPRDTIVLSPTAGLTVVPQNLGDAVIYGAEASATARFRRSLAVSVNYTLIDSRQRSPLVSYDGKRLPQRPRHQFYGRTSLTVRPGGHRVTLWNDLTFVSGNYLDAANLSQVPQRILLGAGLKIAPQPWLLLGFEAKNLTNRRVETIALDPPPSPTLTESRRSLSDFFGYPLPGRSLYMTAEVRY